MTNSEKPKSMPRHPSEAAVRAAYGVLAISLFVGVLLTHWYHFPSISDENVFYPFVLVTRLLPLSSVFWGSLMLVLVGLLVWLIRRRTPLKISLSFALLSLGLFGWIGSVGLPYQGMQITLHNSVMLNNHVYRLIDKSFPANGLSGPGIVYDVIECDTLEVLCHFYDMPINVEGRGERIIPNYDAQLVVRNNALYLRTTEEYRVRSWLETHDGY